MAHLPPSLGGPATLLSGIFSSGLNRGFVLIPFNIGRPPKINVRNNFGYEAILNSGIKRMLFAVWGTFKNFIRFPFMLLEERPDIVHIHTAPYWVFWETIFYVLMCKFARVSCALQMHFSFRYFYEDSTLIFRKLMLWGIRLASVFVLICWDDVKCLKEIDATDITTFYLPNFVDVERVRAGIRENSLISDENTQEILFFGGSDTVRKGLPDLLSTIPYLAQRFPNVYFRLVAVPGDFVSEAVPEIYQDRCIVEGWISGPEKFERLASADIFVLPTHAEGMPISILEAMAAGLPTVASKVAGIPDTIRNGIEGFLIPRGDVFALREAVRVLLESKSLREKMGLNAAERAVKEFDLSVGVSNFKKLYNLMTTKKESHVSGKHCESQQC